MSINWPRKWTEFVLKEWAGQKGDTIYPKNLFGDLVSKNYSLAWVGWWVVSIFWKKYGGWGNWPKKWNNLEQNWRRKCTEKVKAKVTKILSENLKTIFTVFGVFGPWRSLGDQGQTWYLGALLCPKCIVWIFVNI